MKKFLLDTIKAAFGAALTAGIIAFFQYMGAHISNHEQTAGLLAGAFAALRYRSPYV